MSLNLSLNLFFFQMVTPNKQAKLWWKKWEIHLAGTILLLILSIIITAIVCSDSKSNVCDGWLLIFLLLFLTKVNIKLNLILFPQDKPSAFRVLPTGLNTTKTNAILMQDNGHKLLFKFNLTVSQHLHIFIGSHSEIASCYGPE